MIDIAELADQHLDAARTDPHGRSAGSWRTTASCASR